ncbi:IS3 family transposase [Roseateles amylovorans]|uniref:IS3 family transposase n=1 Tax=Roseateles amylovorans TaxID=2978473 RepID=A0ABY6B112_9BURK|nr:IS3 family transposase [Roseateles amylovorans]UXH78369.1 IS3 family transposase [Roseateles amylovorans]
MTEHSLSILRACRAAGLLRAAYYKVPLQPMERDAEVTDALNGVVERNGRWGFWKCFDRLRLDGRPWNHKRVWRVYCELGLNIRRRMNRRIPNREPVPLAAGSYVNQGWALDFMNDVLYDGRRFRTFNVIDEADREALTIQVGQSLPASMLIRTMDRLVDWYGPPLSIRMDNRDRTVCGLRLLC